MCARPLLDAPSDSPAAKEEIIRSAEKQLRLVMLGVPHWNRAPTARGANRTGRATPGAATPHDHPNRKVVAFLSQAHLEPDITLEIFFLDRPMNGAAALDLELPET